MATTGEDAVSHPVSWFRSRHSHGSSDCVEVQFGPGEVLIRDSRYRQNPANDPRLEPMIRLPYTEFSRFLTELSEEDHPDQIGGLHVGRNKDESITLRSTDHGVTLRFTSEQWAPFAAARSLDDFSVPIEDELPSPEEQRQSRLCKASAIALPVSSTGGIIGAATGLAIVAWPCGIIAAGALGELLWCYRNRITRRRKE